VIFATHYLEEADAYADRIVVLAGGRIVADSPPAQIKARVGGRTISATLPDVDLAALSELPGVVGAERRGDTVLLATAHPETALRALLGGFPALRDVDLIGTGLEEAFLALTADQNEANDGPLEVR
jgi:ABC-2 type transport system ATP-binding protein